MSITALMQTPCTLQDLDEGLGVVDTLETTCYAEPEAGTEQLDEQETYTTTWRVFLPPSLVFPESGNPVSASSRVLVGDRTLQVVSALSFTNPRTQAAHHMECVCVEVVG